MFVYVYFPRQAYFLAYWKGFLFHQPLICCHIRICCSMHQLSCSIYKCKEFSWLEYSVQDELSLLGLAHNHKLTLIAFCRWCLDGQKKRTYTDLMNALNWFLFSISHWTTRERKLNQLTTAILHISPGKVCIR